ncbi:MAG: polysaccharide pyruvyl transferase family protein [Deltaproteobacteria bacterium]
MKITYYGGAWPTNIGNAFIDLGAMAILKAALPTATVTFCGEMPRWFFDRGLMPVSQPNPKSLFQRLLGRVFSSNISKAQIEAPDVIQANMNKALDIGEFTACDMVVFSGMAMCQEFIDVNGPTILNLAKRGVKVFLLGTGAEHYTPEERISFRDFLKNINPIGFISRDRPSFDMFADCVERSYDGIDCGFFTPEAFEAPELLHPPYIAISFDSGPEPIIHSNGRAILRAHHDLWGRISRDWVTPKTLISDLPYDYLSLYANAQEIHSDRVHACVAGLAYGNAARLYSPTPRGALFDSVGAHTVRDGLVKLDMATFAAAKEKQIGIVREWASLL